MNSVSRSNIVHRIYQSLESTKDLFVSSIIYGENHTGKKKLISKLYQSSVWVSGNNIDDVRNALNNYSHIVITDFEKITNLSSMDFSNCNVVALYNGVELDQQLKDIFAFIYKMPSLKEREEDIELYTQEFIKEATKLYNLSGNLTVAAEDLDLSENLRSLKRSVYKSLLLSNLSADDINYALSKYFEKNYNDTNVYKKQLRLFEIPLIATGLKIYKSQLKLSDILGINRNTLRKKINEYF